ncbi:MAG: hypothetical protein U0U09_00850 [Cyclobacteriaceae bacterium]
MKTQITKVEMIENPKQESQVVSVSTKWVSTMWAIAFTLTLGAAMLAIAITSTPH